MRLSPEWNVMNHFLECATCYIVFSKYLWTIVFKGSKERLLEYTYCFQITRLTMCMLLGFQRQKYIFMQNGIYATYFLTEYLLCKNVSLLIVRFR